MIGLYFILSLLFLFGTFFLTLFSSCFRKIPRDKSLKSISHRFFYRLIHLYFFPNHPYEGVLFAVFSTLFLTRFLFIASLIAFSLQIENHYLIIISLTMWIITGFAFGEYVPRLLGSRFPKSALQSSEIFVSIFLFTAFPITYFWMKLSRLIFGKNFLYPIHEPIAQAKREIIEMVHQAEVSSTFDIYDKKLIESVLIFKEKMVREIMVPRVNVFSLPHSTPIKDAAKLLEEEGYSRVPVYKDTVDNITGVLMYKDILEKYMRYAEQDNNPKILEAPIESIQKNALYTPETKKIGSLLQDFRKKQVHLAIIVDEYGGTEGIVTIEDVLEEIVGEIEDEYDELEQLFLKEKGGGWIVDARMNLIDVKQRLNIEIPQEGDYDTLGGFIFHRIGSIPSKGVVIHHDEFEIEILNSSERSVKKVRLKSITPGDNQEAEI